MSNSVYRPISFALAMMWLCTGCSQPDPNRVQGYVEGEFVYVASPHAGALETLSVQRGARVNAGDPLFALEPDPEKAGRDEAERRVAQARASLEDAKKGRRPPEIESAEAQIKQGQAALVRSESELLRMQKLADTRVVSSDDIERARATRDQDREKVAQLEADLRTARLGSRDDQVVAAEANLRATEATLTKAEWDLAQKRQAAPQSGLVFDTLYWPGEWVAAGKPVIVLLPPPNVKVRAFVPEQRVGAIKLGDRVQVVVDGVPEPYAGTVRFISPRAEFTPPVIYSRESRGKLVFMIEVRFDPAIAAVLHPGQPVDVLLNP
jgi:HlyD family secretion protein